MLVVFSFTVVCGLLALSSSASSLQAVRQAHYRQFDRLTIGEVEGSTVVGPQVFYEL